jgi:quinol monooxygenase YgiN
MKEIRSMAILKPHPGQEPEMFAFLREFYTMMFTKQYSRDMLFRDPKKPDVFIHIRIWHSKEARDTAVNDPDVHHYWKTLPEFGAITTIYEELECLFSTRDGLDEGANSADSGI